MKTIYKLRIALYLSTAIFSFEASAQAYLSNPKYGPDEKTRTECATNLSLYREQYNQRNFNDARKPWQRVLQVCPAASQNAYIHGIQMLKFWIENEKNPTRKNQLEDSLMMVYDMRIEHFSQKGLLLGMKGMDLFQIDPERYVEAYRYLAESINIEKTNSSTSAIFTYMVLTKAMYDNRKIEADKVIETYSMLSDYLDAMIAAKPADDKLPQAKDSVDEIFRAAGVANCDNLVQIFEPRVKTNPKDLELAKKVLSLLTASKCNTLPLYRMVGATVFDSEPAPQLAYELARIFLNNREFRNAERYYQEAIKLQADSLRKSIYLFEYANLTWRELNNPQQARSLALQALNFNPALGHAFMLIGNLYASEKNCVKDDFEKRTVFWAAVDKFIRAKQVDPSLAADCDKLIELYSGYFPEQKDIFFQDLNPGASYTVGCWINEKTTIRAR